MKRTMIILSIDWDDTIGQDHPALWHYHNLFDMLPHENVEILWATEVE